MGRWLRRLGGVVLVLGSVALLGLALVFNAFDKPGPLAGNVIVVIPSGAGVGRIGEVLERQGVVRSALVFRAGVRLTGNQGRLKAGEYDFSAHPSARQVMQILVSGRTLVRKLTIPEGVTRMQALQLVRAAYGLRGQVLRTPGEGEILPDTYHYSYGDGRDAVVQRMEQAMNDAVVRLWRERDPALPLRAPGEAVILASIVEKETGVPAERPLIAAVFLNRLARGMRLQSDPTVAYGAALAEGAPTGVLARPLTTEDLKAPGPYNTYLIKGLPPAPIANPGRAALEAVLHPAETDALYFVADGSGGHAFARTLDEHNRNVNRWRRINANKADNAGPAKPKPKSGN